MSPSERAILEAVVDRLIPSDECGPGAVEAGVMRYMERAWAAHREAYAGGLAALGESFCDLEPEAQDAALAALERDGAAFFALVRTHAIEGMFGDPRWGGNADFAGWDLLGYAGLRRVWTAAEQRLDVIVPPTHQGRDDLEDGSR